MKHKILLGAELRAVLATNQVVANARLVIAERTQQVVAVCGAYVVIRIVSPRFG